MVDAVFVTVCYGVEQLKKDLLRKSIVADVVVSFGDGGKEITLRAILHDDVNTIGTVKYFYNGYDVGMLLCSTVEGDFTGLEFLLRIIEGETIWADFGEGFDGVWYIIDYIDGSVYYTVCADAEDFDELDIAVKEETNSTFGSSRHDIEMEREEGNGSVRPIERKDKRGDEFGFADYFVSLCIY